MSVLLARAEHGYVSFVSVEMLAVVVTIVLALVGFAVKYVNDLRLAQRKDRLDWISRQLSDLYGPLYATNAATNRLWSEFVRLYTSPSSPTFWKTSETTDAFRLWITTVFMPLNVEMRNAVVQHADLLRDPEGMPRCLLDLCAHVAGYETVLERWRSGAFDPSDHDQNTPLISYPDELASYVQSAYFELKREQAELLRGLGLDRGGKHRDD